MTGSPRRHGNRTIRSMAGRQGTRHPRRPPLMADRQALPRSEMAVGQAPLMDRGQGSPQTPSPRQMADGQAPRSPSVAATEAPPRWRAGRHIGGMAGRQAPLRWRGGRHVPPMGPRQGTRLRRDPSRPPLMADRQGLRGNKAAMAGRQAPPCSRADPIPRIDGTHPRRIRVPSAAGSPGTSPSAGIAMNDLTLYIFLGIFIIALLTQNGRN